jgi:antitoxin component YwqK of YwqJK toxin-antitoxin module
LILLNNCAQSGPNPNEIYTDGEYLTLVSENKSSRGNHWATYLDSEGNPYSGEVNWYFKANDQLSRKEVYDNGKQVRVDIYDIMGNWVWLSNNEISEDQNGIKYLESYQKTENDSIYLAFDLVWDGNSHTVKEYYLNGQLRHEYTYNTLVNRVNGMAYQYDEEGNITKLERYENGILIETIK